MSNELATAASFSVADDVSALQLKSTSSCSLSSTLPSSPSSIRETFAQDGVVGPLDILSRADAREVLEEILDWQQQQQKQTSHHNNNNNINITGNLRFKPHLHLPKLNRLIVRNPILIQAVQEALRSTTTTTTANNNGILLWSSDLNIKPAHSPFHFAPHQDATYTGLHPAEKCLTAWIALSDPVGEREGCLQFWKRSYCMGQLPHEQLPHNADPYNILSRGQRIANLAQLFNNNTGAWSSIPLRAGQATLHHFHTVHQSGPNQNAQSVRIGLACRFIDATVQRAVDVGVESSNNNTKEFVTLIFGNMLHDGFELEPDLPESPTEQELERGRQAHAISMEREAANYFQGSSTNEQQYDERTKQNICAT